MKVSLMAMLKKSGFSLCVAAAAFLWTTCDVGLGEAVDTMAPTVTVTSPSASSVIADSVVISGDCFDDKGISSINIVVTNTGTGEKFTVNADVASDQKSWTKSINDFIEGSGYPLKDGSYTADVTAIDVFGRSSGTSSTAFDIDNTPPLFCVTSPASLDITNPRKYGRSVTISGEIADDHDIAKMAIRVFRVENGASTEITGSLAKTEFSGFETAGGTTVYIAKYFDQAPAAANSDGSENPDYALYQNYMAIYGNAALGTDVFVYVVATLTDIAGNTSDRCYLSSNLKNLAAQLCGVEVTIDSLQTAQLMKVLNGTYTGGELNDEQRAKIVSLLNGTYALQPGEASYLSRYDDADAAKQSPLAASVNSNNSPTYDFNGYENPTTSAQGWVSVNTGGNVTITLAAGRDGWGILPGSLVVNLYICDAYGKKTFATPDFSSRNELDPTGAATVLIRDATNKEIANIETSVTNQSYYVTLPALRAGNRYLLEATGKDENDSALVPQNGNLYGFIVASSITPPTLSASDLFYVRGAGAKADGSAFIRVDIKDESDEIGVNGVIVDGYLCADHIAAKSYINAYITGKTPDKTVVYKNTDTATAIKPVIDAATGREIANQYWFDLPIKDFGFTIADDSNYTVVLRARAKYKGLDGNMVGTDVEDRGQGFPHLGPVRRELRFLRDDRDVGIADAPGLELRQRQRLPEQGFAGRTQILRVVVRVVLADVAEGQGPEHGVDESVKRDVGVAVSVESGLVGDVTGAEHQIAFRRHAVHVVADSDPKVLHTFRFSVTG